LQSALKAGKKILQDLKESVKCQCLLVLEITSLMQSMTGHNQPISDQNQLS